MRAPKPVPAMRVTPEKPGLRVKPTATHVNRFPKADFRLERAKNCGFVAQRD